MHRIEVLRIEDRGKFSLLSSLFSLLSSRGAETLFKSGFIG
jgi:hypothetical protein